MILLECHRHLRFAREGAMSCFCQEFSIAERVGDAASNERIFVVPGVADERPPRAEWDSEEIW